MEGTRIPVKTEGYILSHLLPSFLTINTQMGQIIQVPLYDKMKHQNSPALNSKKNKWHMKPFSLQHIARPILETALSDGLAGQ